MIASMVIDYSCGQGIRVFGANKKLRKLFLLLSVTLNLGILFTFKYSGFLFENLRAIGIPAPYFDPTLPLGISFYTFQTMSYPIDVFRGDPYVRCNYLHFGTVAALSPQLLAGPIVFYMYATNLHGFRPIRFDKFPSGLECFQLSLPH